MSKCESCGSELKPGAQFCEACGAPVTAAQTSAPQAEPIPNPAPQYAETTDSEFDPADYGLAPESPKKKKKNLIIGIVVLVVLVIAAAALGLGKGKYADSPYVGTWEATSYESGGIEISTDAIGESKMILKDNGDIAVWFGSTADKDKGEGKWKPTDKGIEITDDSSEIMTATYSGGVLSLAYGGVTMNFEKTGGSAAKTGTASSAAPAAASPAASAADSAAVKDGDSYSADFCGYWVCDGMYGDNDEIVSEYEGTPYAEMYKYELKADRSAVIYFEGQVTNGTWENTGNTCTVHDEDDNDYYLELCDDHSQMNEYADDAQFRYSKQEGHIS